MGKIQIRIPSYGAFRSFSWFLNELGFVDIETNEPLRSEMHTRHSTRTGQIILILDLKRKQVDWSNFHEVKAGKIVSQKEAFKILSLLNNYGG